MIENLLEGLVQVVNILTAWLWVEWWKLYGQRKGR